MTPQRAVELEAELRRRAAAAERTANESVLRLRRDMYDVRRHVLTEAADLVRDAAKGE